MFKKTTINWGNKPQSITFGYFGDLIYIVRIRGRFLETIRYNPKIDSKELAGLCSHMANIQIKELTIS